MKKIKVKIIGIFGKDMYEVKINGKYGLIKISSLYELAEKFHMEIE